MLASFEQAYAAHDVHVEVESFTRIDEAIARLQDPSSDFDVVFPVIDVLPGMVAAGLLRPLNHDYLPHLSNLWGWFRDGDGPFYDPGQRYTTPYTIYTGGIGWRADMVARRRRARSRAPTRTTIFTDARYRDRVGIYDAYRDAIALGLQQAGVHDLRAATSDQLDRGRQLPRRRGRAHQRALHRRRRGGGPARTDLRGAPGVVGRHPDRAALRGRRRATTRRRSPPRCATGRRASRRGSSGSTSPRSARAGRNPVAAHAFLDHLLRFDVALDNFAWNGYQVPMEGATREAFADPSFRWHGAVPANLRDAIVSEDEFAAGQMLVGFGPSQDAAWLAQWSRVVPA